MKALAVLCALTLTSFAFAAPVSVPMDNDSIELAIELADKHPGTFSMDENCAKNEFELTSLKPDHDVAEVKLITARAEHKLEEEERDAVIDLMIRLGVPMVDTGCAVKFSKVKITGAGCGDQMQKWSASYESI